MVKIGLPQNLERAVDTIETALTSGEVQGDAPIGIPTEEEIGQVWDGLVALQQVVEELQQDAQSIE